MVYILSVFDRVVRGPRSHHNIMIYDVCVCKRPNEVYTGVLLGFRYTMSLLQPADTPGINNLKIKLYFNKAISCGCGNNGNLKLIKKTVHNYHGNIGVAMHLLFIYIIIHNTMRPIQCNVLVLII